MRKIDRTHQFKKDYKRELKGRFRSELDELFMAAVELLQDDLPLPARMRDHTLTGEWRDHRDCHLKPDLVLITDFLMSFHSNWFALDPIANWGCESYCFGSK